MNQDQVTSGKIWSPVMGLHFVGAGPVVLWSGPSGFSPTFTKAWKDPLSLSWNHRAECKEFCVLFRCTLLLLFIVLLYLLKWATFPKLVAFHCGVLYKKRPFMDKKKWPLSFSHLTQIEECLLAFLIKRSDFNVFKCFVMQSIASALSAHFIHTLCTSYTTRKKHCRTMRFGLAPNIWSHNPFPFPASITGIIWASPRAATVNFPLLFSKVAKQGCTRCSLPKLIRFVYRHPHKRIPCQQLKWWQIQDIILSSIFHIFVINCFGWIYVWYFMEF